MLCNCTERHVFCYAQCHYAECHYAECHYAECHYAECHYAECHYAECHYAECHYAECHYAKCHGATHTSCQFFKTQGRQIRRMKFSADTKIYFNRVQGLPDVFNIHFCH
jgi:hypothetical protein